MKKIFLAVGLFMSAVVCARAADERARFDLNQIPGMIAVDSITGEIRKVKTNAAGQLEVETSPAGGGDTPVSQGAAGVAPWLVTGALDPFTQAFAHRCVNTAGTGFESCGGAGGAAIQDVNIISTFSATNPGYVIANQGGVWTVGLSAGVNSIGTVGLDAGVASIGLVGLNAGVNSIGTIGLETGVNSIGSIALDAGAAIVGKVGIDQTTPGTTNRVDIGAFGAALPAGANTIGTVNAAQSGAWILSANSGVDIGDVTVNNAGGASAVNIQDGGNTISVDMAALPLPSGAATSALQTSGNASLASIDGKIPASPATDRATAGGPGSVRLSDGAAFYNATTPSDTQPISAAALPLPAGAATAANQATGNGSLASIDGKMAALGQGAMAASMPVAIASDQSAIPISDGGGTISVDGTVNAAQSGAWTVTANAGTGTMAVDPSDRAGRVNGYFFLRNPGDTVNLGDAANPVRVDPVGTTPQPATQSGSWTVVLGAGAAAVGSVSVSNAGAGAAVNIQDGGNTITVDGTIAATQSGTWTVDNAAGASAVNIQDGGNTISIDGTVTANQGGAWTLSSNSGVDIGDVTINNGVAAAAVNIQDGGNSITVDGSVSGSGLFDMTGSSVSIMVVDGQTIPIDDGGGTISVDGTIAATQSGSWTVDNAGAGAAVNIQDGGNTITVDAAALPLPAGAATSANQTTGNSSLSSIDGKLAALGQAAMAGSMPVAIASDQSAIPISDGGGTISVDGTIAATQSGAWTVDNAGAGSAVNIQDGGNIITVDGTIAATQSGSWTVDNAAGASAVNIQDGGNTISIDAAALPLPAGAATSANQTTGNSSLSSIDGKMAALGQAAMAGSMPVALASDQSAIPVSQSGTWTADPGAFTNPNTTNGTCATGSATLVLAANGSAATTGICNEGTADIRIGGAGISSVAGFLVRVDSCMGVDGPAKAFQGALYCTSTDGATQAYSTFQGD